MAPPLIARATRATPLTPLSPPDLRSWLLRQSRRVKSWVAGNGFSAKPNEICPIPRQAGGIERVLVGYNADDAHWGFAALPGTLPLGTYRLDESHLGESVRSGFAAKFALGWELGAYRFTRYSKKKSKPLANLVWPAGVDRAAIRRTVEAIFLVRDLINTPASDMGPVQLAEVAAGLAKRFGARCEIIEGDALLARNYPLIHAVGRASAKGPRGSARDRQPRLVDIRWGREGALKVTLVGKGVCFDSGGLNLKAEAGMKMMKKDMGGAAHVLGLALMIMDAGLDVRLRVLVPAVENSVSAESMRPLDVVKSRKGITVEIGNTDAEGRLILADALAEASREKPAMLIDCATLTGAARVALGPDLPALFCNDESLAADILRVAAQETDPVWRLPLWFPYCDGLESNVADISSISESPHGGAITAALFLSEFVEKGTPWAHFDIMAWNVTGKPGRPKGGEAMGIRALFALIAERAAASPVKMTAPTSVRQSTRRLRGKPRPR